MALQSTTDTLIENHREYARKLAREIQRKLPSHVSFDDLVGFGELGLVEAAGKYDPGCGAAFTTFAYFRIRGAIFDGLGKMTGMTPALRRQLRQEEGMDEVAQSTPPPAGNPESVSNSMRDAVGRLGAVFIMANTGSDQVIEGQDDADPGQTVEDREAMEKVQAALTELPDELSEIIQLFYIDEMSMTDIATKLSIHKSNVSRRHAKAIDALREALAA